MNFKRLFSSLRRCAVAGVFWTLATSAALALPASFHAVYGVVKGPLRLGQCELQLKTRGQNYQFLSEARPAGLALLLSSRKIVQTAEGRWSHAGPVPAVYERRVNEGDGWNRDTVFIGEHPRTDARAAAQHRLGQVHRLVAAHGVLDPASLLLQLMADVRQDRAAHGYEVVDEAGKTHRYLVQDRGKARVAFHGRDIEARVLRRVRVDGSDALTVYSAPALNGLPVRMDYVEAGITWQLSLEKVVWGAGGTQAAAAPAPVEAQAASALRR